MLVGYGFVDPDAGEVDGPVEWKVHLRPGDSFAVLGTFDGIGRGEAVTPVYDVAAGQPFRAEVRFPVDDGILGERLFEVWIGNRQAGHDLIGDAWLTGNPYKFGPADAVPPPEFGAEGTRWGTAVNPAGK